MKPDKYENYGDFSFKSFFTPFTSVKAIFFIIVIGFIVYGNMLFNGFVWDDYPYLLNNADIRSINIPYLLGENIFNDASFYRPLPALYNAVIYSLVQYEPFAYHFIQLILHCLNACLIYLLFKKFLSNKISFILTLIFLIHPINVESVAYISAANNVLFSLFGMLALLISTKAKIQRVDLFLVCMLSLLSLLTRETGMAFLFLIVVFQYMFVRKRTVVFLGIEMVALTLYFLLRFGYAGIFYTKEMTIYPIPMTELSLLQRLENIPSILFYYFSHIFYPVNFAVGQHWIVTSKTINNFYLPLLIESIIFSILIVLAILIYKSRRELFRIYIFFFLWFLSGMVFILQIVPLELTVADHWIYFPLIGLLGIVGVCIDFTVKKLRSRNFFIRKRTTDYYTTVIAVLILIVLTYQTIIRNSNFKDEITLYTHDSAIYNDWKLENDLGSDYARIGDMKNAYIHFKRSYELSPTPWNIYHLGLYYENSGDTKKAIVYYSNALNAHKALAKESNLEYNLYLHLSNASILAGNYSAAIEYAKAGIKYYPESSDLWVALAVGEYLTHNKQNALQASIRAKELSLNSKTTYLYKQIADNKPLNLH